MDFLVFQVVAICVISCFVLYARLPEEPQLPELESVKAPDPLEAPETDPFGLDALVPEQKKYASWHHSS